MRNIDWSCMERRDDQAQEISLLSLSVYLSCFIQSHHLSFYMRLIFYKWTTAFSITGAAAVRQPPFRDSSTTAENELLLFLLRWSFRSFLYIIVAAGQLIDQLFILINDAICRRTVVLLLTLSVIELECIQEHCRSS